MPRAFLITHRRYNTAVEYNERRESSPERCVSVAELGGQPPASIAAPSPADTSRSSSECPEELYNLTQLAEVSLAAAAGHLFTNLRRIDVHPQNRHKHHFDEFHNDGDSRSENEENQHILEDDDDDNDDDDDDGHTCDHYDEHDGELHEGTPTTGEIHACRECGKRYSTGSNLARHRQTHRSLGDKKARRCPHCDKVYVSMPAFSMHVRTHNQGCKCAHCGKCFSRPWLLQGHIRTHTGEKPFKCSICTKAFADKSNLRAHVQTHSNTKPHVCGRCGKAFALKSYLYKHEESSCMRVVEASTATPLSVPTLISQPPRQMVC